jgi:hypothetical protein
MAALGHQLRQVGVLLGQAGERRVAELLQCPAVGTAPRRGTQQQVHDHPRPAAPGVAVHGTIAVAAAAAAEPLKAPSRSSTFLTVPLATRPHAAYVSARFMRSLGNAPVARRAPLS